MFALSKLLPQLSPNNLALSKEDIEAIIKSKSTIIIVAEENGIVGTLTMVLSTTLTGKKLWIEDVVVDIAMRGRGIGEKLLQFAIRYAQENDIYKIDLTSMPTRVSANKLYRNLGFIKRETNVYRLIISS